LGDFERGLHFVRLENGKCGLRIPGKVYQLLIKSTNCWKRRG